MSYHLIHHVVSKMCVCVCLCPSILSVVLEAHCPWGVDRKRWWLDEYESYDPTSGGNFEVPLSWTPKIDGNSLEVKWQTSFGDDDKPLLSKKWWNSERNTIKRMVVVGLPGWGFFEPNKVKLFFFSQKRNEGLSWVWVDVISMALPKSCLSEAAGFPTQLDCIKVT